MENITEDKDVKNKIVGQLKTKEINNNDLNDEVEWKNGLAPEEEEEFRKVLVFSLDDSFENGKSTSIKAKRRTKEIKNNDIVVRDSYAINTKEYLKKNYNCRSQICAEQIKLVNGESYIETFHISEGKDENWWGERAYNVLGLCPNCHAKAKYGGIEYAKLLEGGEIFPDEVEEFKSDMYIVPVVIIWKKF